MIHIDWPHTKLKWLKNELSNTYGRVKVFRLGSVVPLVPAWSFDISPSVRPPRFVFTVYNFRPNVSYAGGRRHRVSYYVVFTNKQRTRCLFGNYIIPLQIIGLGHYRLRIIDTWIVRWPRMPNSVVTVVGNNSVWWVWVMRNLCLSLFSTVAMIGSLCDSIIFKAIIY